MEKGSVKSIALKNGKTINFITLDKIELDFSSIEFIKLVGKRYKGYNETSIENKAFIIRSYSAEEENCVFIEPSMSAYECSAELDKIFYNRDAIIELLDAVMDMDVTEMNIGKSLAIIDGAIHVIIQADGRERLVNMGKNTETAVYLMKIENVYQLAEITGLLFKELAQLLINEHNKKHALTAQELRTLINRIDVPVCRESESVMVADAIESIRACYDEQSENYDDYEFVGYDNFNNSDSSEQEQREQEQREQEQPELDYFTDTEEYISDEEYPEPDEYDTEEEYDEPDDADDMEFSDFFTDEPTETEFDETEFDETDEENQSVFSDPFDSDPFGWENPEETGLSDISEITEEHNILKEDIDLFGEYEAFPETNAFGEMNNTGTFKELDEAEKQISIERAETAISDLWQAVFGERGPKIKKLEIKFLPDSQLDLKVELDDTYMGEDLEENVDIDTMDEIG